MTIDRDEMKYLARHEDSICILGGGACTSVGLTMLSSAAAVRAGVASFCDHPYVVDTEGEPMVVAWAPHLSQDALGADRYVQLATPAAREALAVLGEYRVRVRAIPVIIGLPAPRPGLPRDLAGEVAQRLKDTIVAEFPISEIDVIPTGHAAGLMALESALKRLRRAEADVCLIGGVDSYLEAETLEWLESCDQVHSAGALNNAWGFIPGEGSGFCLVSTARAAGVLGVPVLGMVDAASTSMEANLIKTESVCLGRGLTEVFERVLAVLPSPTKVDDVICDLNGEPYRGDEFGFATLRTSMRFADLADFQTPADCWGDVGAASGPLFVNLAVIAAAKGYAKGPYTLVWASSESGERSAALLHASIRDQGEPWP